MFGNVLVGVNGGEGGRDAIALATTLLAEDGELTFAHVFHEAFPGPHDRTYPAALELREHARQLLEGASAEAGVPAHLRWRDASSVGRGLHELAEMIEADLLVVGSSRRALVGRVGLQDDTRAALNGAPCAIAVAPAGYRTEALALIREIGVAYDGSPESEHALRFARTLAAGKGSRLSAFQAVSIPAYIYAGAAAHVKAGAIERVVSLVRQRMATLDGVEPHVAYGDPVEELTLYSASLDLLVVGSRSYGPLGRVVHGSTAQHLARTVRCPLLVLTRGARTTGLSLDSAPALDSALAAR